MDKLVFLFELSIRGLKSNIRTNLIVMFSLALGLVMPLIALANINVFLVNIKNLYPNISQNTFFCNVQSPHLIDEDYEEIREGLEIFKIGGVENVSGDIRVEDMEFKSALRVISEDYLDFVKMDILKGRCITKEEIQAADRVCMLEEMILLQYDIEVEEGIWIWINGERYEVVGVFRSMILDKSVIIPNGTYVSRKLEGNNDYSMFVQYDREMSENKVTSELAKELEKIISVQSMDDFFDRQRSICIANSLVIFMMTVPIMIFSLINCTLVLYGKIVEMRYENAIKMAVGARKREIFLSCILENNILAIGAYLIDILLLPVICQTVPKGFVLLFDWKVYLISIGLMEALIIIISQLQMRRIMKVNLAAVLKGE